MRVNGVNGIGTTHDQVAEFMLHRFSRSDCLWHEVHVMFFMLPIRHLDTAYLGC